MKGDCATSKQELQDAYKKLCMRLGSEKSMLVLALDEIQQITESQSARERGYSPSRMLGRAIADFTQSKKPGPAVWVLFASTDSRVTDFTPPDPTCEFKLTVAFLA